MNLKKKKELAARTFKVGKERIIFQKSRLEEIKEAITRQDIKDLYKGGAIIIKEIKGRKKKKGKIKKKRRARGVGNIKKKIRKRKQDYITLVRKLRKYVSELKKQERLSKEEIFEIRKKIRNKDFRDINHLKEYIKGLKK